MTFETIQIHPSIYSSRYMDQWLGQWHSLGFCFFTAVGQTQLQLGVTQGTNWHGRGLLIEAVPAAHPVHKNQIEQNMSRSHVQGRAAVRHVLTHHHKTGLSPMVQLHATTLLFSCVGRWHCFMHLKHISTCRVLWSNAANARFCTILSCFGCNSLRKRFEKLCSKIC